MIIIPANPVVYRGTLADLRISSVSGTALLDNCAALVPYADGLHRVEIYDSAGRQLVGYLSAQGAGETLSGVEKLTDGGLENWDSDTNLTSWVEYLSGASTINKDAVNVHGGSFAANFVNDATGVGTYIRENITDLAVGGVYKISAWIKANSGTPSVAFDFQVTNYFPVTTSYVKYDKYQTVTETPKTIFFRSYSAASKTLYWDDLSLQQQTAPSTNGIVVVSTKSGATQNFARKNASFTYNAASYYCVVRKMR